MKKNKSTPELNEPLIDSFVEMYSPCSSEDEADVLMDYAKLREFFGCIFLDSTGKDLLPHYINALNGFNFFMQVSYSGEPCVFLKSNNKPVRFCPILDDASPSPASLPEKPVLAKFPSDLKTLEE